MDRYQTYTTTKPSSFTSNEDEVRNYYPGANNQTAIPHESTFLTPYLGLRARLSQVWINRWTVLLLLVLFRFLFSVSSVNSLIADARIEALSACYQVENIGSNIASLPYYMSTGVNRLTADGISKAVNGLHTMVDLSLVGVQEIVIFYIGMLTNTYLCLLTAAVSGGVSSALGAVEDAQNKYKSDIQQFTSKISSGADKLDDQIKSLVSGINTVFGSSVPSVDFSSEINDIVDYTLLNDMASLKKLNSSLPSFNEVKNFTEDLIATPFKELRALIDQNWGQYEFNGTVFPVPEKTALSFCSNNNHFSNFFDKLASIAATARKVAIAVLVTLAIACCLPMAWLEMRRYRNTKVRAYQVKNYAVDSIDAVYLVSRPYTSNVGRSLGGRFQSNRRQTLVRWWVAYVTTFPALLLLSLALAGFFSCFCQWLLLKAITKEVPSITAEITGFAEDILGTINNSSLKWANDANAVIIAEQNKINSELLGWVTTSTTAVNNTLNGFIDESVSVMKTLFGDSILYDAVSEVFNCLIGIKVAGIEQGLTWIHDNAQVAFPALPNNTLTLSSALSAASGPGSGSAPGSDLLNDPTGITSSAVAAAVEKVSNRILATIRQEALLSLLLLLAYVVIMLVGAVYVVMAARSDARALPPGVSRAGGGGGGGGGGPGDHVLFREHGRADDDASEIYAPAPVRSAEKRETQEMGFAREEDERVYSEKGGVEKKGAVGSAAGADEDEYTVKPVKYYSSMFGKGAFGKGAGYGSGSVSGSRFSK